MKKYLVLIAVILSLVLLISCKKTNPSDPAPSALQTATPTITITPTFTISGTATVTATITPTNTALPSVYIIASINCVNTYVSYWFTLNVAGVSYQYATITVNSETLEYRPASSVYASQAGSNTPVVQGSVFNVSIQTHFGTYTASITAPGENVSITNYVVSYDHDGTDDFVLVRNGASVLTYSSFAAPDSLTDIDPGFTIPEALAFPISGSYNVSVYPYNMNENAFTGPTVPTTNHLEVECLTEITVVKP